MIVPVNDDVLTSLGGLLLCGAWGKGLDGVVKRVKRKICLRIYLG